METQVDAWDELRSALRSFSIDRIRGAIEVDERAHEVSESALDEHFASAYGIYAVCAALSLFFVRTYITETKGRTLEEMDHLR